LAWFPANIYYLALPLLVGLDASAALRAMLNLIMPLLMTIGAINGVMLPMFVRTLANQGQPALDRLLASIVRWAVLAAVAWSVFITFLGEFVISWLYNGQYDSYVTPLMLFIMGLIPVVAAFNRIVDTALRAMGGVRRAFFSRLLPTILTMTMGLGLVAAFGIIGAHASSVLTGAVTMVILIRFYRLQKQEREKAT
ncbi:MAG: lipopolysaccharide biosynthesis protein, partial [Phototrophicaceae bacterium]